MTDLQQEPAVINMNAHKKLIALIVPVFNESDNIKALHTEIVSVFSNLPNYDWKMVYVDDGSKDNSWEIIEGLCETDNHVHGILLSRNFSKELAMTAGLEAAGDADAVIFLDADLQHPPEKIPEFIKEWENGAETVIGIRTDVKDHSIIKKACSWAFNHIFKFLSDIEIHPKSTDFRLIDKKVVTTLSRFSERSRMLRGLIDWLGYKKSFIDFKAPPRPNGGKPTYSYKRLYQLAINSITTFSLLPLRLTGYLGALVSSLSGILLMYMLFTDIVGNQVYTARAYIIVFNTVLVGIMLFALGLIALYIGNIHTEVMGRPLYVISKKKGKKRRNPLANEHE